jgi:hypothetical protein
MTNRGDAGGTEVMQDEQGFCRMNRDSLKEIRSRMGIFLSDSRPERDI